MDNFKRNGGWYGIAFFTTIYLVLAIFVMPDWWWRIGLLLVMIYTYFTIP